MIGIIIQLAISWLIIWLVEKGDLAVLGFFQTKKRLLDFGLFFFVTAFCCASQYLLRMYFAKEEWQLNPALSARLIFDGTWWNIKSVLFEELIFRGVLLYLIIKFGSVRGIIISAIDIGIYHWFSFEVVGEIKQMAITFAMTGIMGLLLA